MTKAAHTASTTYTPLRTSLVIGLDFSGQPKPAARALSYVLGMLAGTCEFAGARVIQSAMRMRTRISKLAPAHGAYLDGYDLVTDFAARKAYARAQAKYRAMMAEREAALRLVWNQHADDGSACGDAR